jgi:hypothetical protein
MLKVFANGDDIEDSHENIQKAVKYVKNESSLRHLSRFHHFLQVSVSYRTLEEENSERFMLKYYEYLFRIKNFLYEKYSIDVLSNLDQFPLETDDCFKEYYEKIAQKVDQYGYCVPCLIRRAAMHKAFGNDGTVYTEMSVYKMQNKNSEGIGIQLRSFQYAIDKIKHDRIVRCFIYISQDHCHKMMIIYKN